MAGNQWVSLFFFIPKSIGIYGPLLTTLKFNSSPLKNGGWKTILSYWVLVAFQGRAVKLPGGITGAHLVVSKFFFQIFLLYPKV